MPTTTTRPTDETQIRGRIDALATAIGAKDLEAVMAHYGSDVVTFDLMPLQTRGADAYRKNFEAWFASVQGPIGFEIRDLHITTGDALGFCHYVGHVTSTRTTGERTDYRVRVTAGLKKLNDRWTITHEHISVPFTNRETMLAAIKL